MWPGTPNQVRYPSLRAWLQGEEREVWLEFLADTVGLNQDVVSLGDWLEANYPYLLEAYNITHLGE